MRAVGVELGGVRAGEAYDAARKFNHRDLEAETDPQVGDLLLAGVAHAGDLSVDPALPETAGHDDPVESLTPEPAGDIVRRDLGGVEPFHVNLGGEVGRGVFDRAINRGVGVAQRRVLAGDSQGHLVTARSADLVGILRPSPP